MGSLYCYDITGTISKQDAEKRLTAHVEGLYTKKKGGFGKDEALPFVTVYAEKDNQICIKMTSVAKKNVPKIQAVHDTLTKKDLTFGGVILSKPKLVEAEQCKWWNSKDACGLGQIKKWDTLSHNGPYFGHLYDPYKPHGIPIIYNKTRVKLNAKEEQVASF